jgi:hypothetical protein
MEPVRIKLYGLFSTTRRGYVRQLLVAGLLCLALLSFRLSLPPLPAHEELLRNQPSFRIILGFWTHLHWIVLGLMALLAVEALVVFRRFAREEARRQAAAPVSQPSTPNPG